MRTWRAATLPAGLLLAVLWGCGSESGGAGPTTPGAGAEGGATGGVPGSAGSLSSGGAPSGGASGSGGSANLGGSSADSGAAGSLGDAGPGEPIDAGSTAVCASGSRQCKGNTPQVCNSMGKWQDGAPCTAPETCGGGSVVGECGGTAPSCVGLPAECGPADESCCATSLVPGGTFSRSNDSASPATVSDFVLDRFEITVGRFRRFVAAYQPTMTPAGAGKNPSNVHDPGWDPQWNSSLPADSNALREAVKCVGHTWTDAPAGNETRPMNCLHWREAFALCIWDGGRLPTEAEWNYAAAGGNEQREYPWSDPPGDTTIDQTYAAYGQGIQSVGSKSAKGDGRWGHADLAGSLREWVVDLYGDYLLPCNDCSASVSAYTSHVTRGGSYAGPASNLRTALRGSAGVARFPTVGARCARTP